MINFFKKKENKNNDIDYFSKVASLLIHIAKIDQVYTDKEKEIIVNTIVKLGAEKENLEKIRKKVEKKKTD